MSNTATLHRRTFEAKNASGVERERLNLDALTSEYNTSYRYLVRWPGVMSDGSPNQAQPWHNRSFRTHAEAQTFMNEFNHILATTP